MRVGLGEITDTVFIDDIDQFSKDKYSSSLAERLALPGTRSKAEWRTKFGTPLPPSSG